MLATMCIILHCINIKKKNTKKEFFNSYIKLKNEQSCMYKIPRQRDVDKNYSPARYKMHFN